MNVHVTQLLYYRTAIKNFKTIKNYPPDVFVIHNINIKIP